MSTVFGALLSIWDWLSTATPVTMSPLSVIVFFIVAFSGWKLIKAFSEGLKDVLDRVQELETTRAAAIDTDIKDLYLDLGTILERVQELEEHTAYSSSTDP